MQPPAAGSAAPRGTVQCGPQLSLSLSPRLSPLTSDAANMRSIADQLLEVAQLANPSRPARLIYFQTTIPGGVCRAPHR
jgi:hypothetical protein